MSLELPRGLIQDLVKTNTIEISGSPCLMKAIEAITQIYEIIRTSYGPKGAHKLVVNSYGNIILGKSCSTILTEMEVEHPSVRFLVPPIEHLDLLGDCTGFMLSFTAIILKQSVHLLKQGVRPTEISTGLRNVQEELKKIVEQSSHDIPFSISREKDIKAVLKGVLMEKKKLEDLLSECVSSIVEDGDFDTDNIRVSKAGVGNLEDSQLVKGLLLDGEPTGAVKKADLPLVAIYNCPLSLMSLETKGTALFKTAEDLLGFTRKDEEMVKNEVDEILSTGASVIIFNGSADPLILDHLNARNVVAMKVVSKFDLIRIWKLVGGRISNQMRKIDRNFLGRCDKLDFLEEGRSKFTRMQKEGKVVTILLKSEFFSKTDEFEKLVQKGISVLKFCAVESKEKGTIKVLKGSGNCEKEISEKLLEKSGEYGDIRQECMKIIAESLMDVSNEVRKINDGSILDIYSIKERAIEYAILAACDILSISHIFITESEEKLKAPKRMGHWDDED